MQSRSTHFLLASCLMGLIGSVTPGLRAQSDPPAPTFTNVTVHDPSVVRAGSTYYVFGSHMASASTTDLIHWTQISTSAAYPNSLIRNQNPQTEFSEALAWAQTTTFWAPDVIKLADNRYYYYYCACRGDSPLSALGLAVSNSITGPYSNVGLLLKSGMAGLSPDGTVYNNAVHPNVVDPSVFFDQTGKLWMVYGSYSGGIFILSLDPATGQPVAGQAYGKKLIGGNNSTIEGPYILYSPESAYYYLFFTFGGLDASGGYNIRVGRSRNPDGPYFDSAGNDLTNVKGAPNTYFDNASIAPYGAKLMGNYQFLHVAGEPTTTSRGYVSPGGASANYDPATGKYLLVFHTRFVGRGEEHEVRVHQMFLNADGWPVVAPQRYAQETIATTDANQIPGDFKLINHGKDITATVKNSSVITLKADHSVMGAATGTWQLTGDYYATLTIGGIIYRGVFVRLWDDDNQVWTLTFTAMSGDGVSVWGSKVAVNAPASAPAFTTQPASQSVAPGAVVTFTATASGSPAPAFQWKKDGNNLGGATGSTYTIASATAGDAGGYTVVATNSAGSVASNAAILTVTAVTSPTRAPADFDGDGQSDLVWQNTLTGERSFWLMNGTTFKVGVELGTFAPDWTVVGAGDFNHDGQPDLLWQNTITGERSVWLMQGTALNLGVDLGTYSTDWMIAGSGDFNGDDETDIVLQNTITGERMVWLMNGTTKMSEASLGVVPTACSIAGTGDFNGDGKVDLIWQNAATGECTVWLMNGLTKSSEVSLGMVAKQMQIVGTGDYNRDGKTDLVWTDTETGERSIWLMNGLVPLSKVVVATISVEWSLDRPIFLTAQTARADFNADGQTDLIWQNRVTGDRTVTLMNGTAISSTAALTTTATNWVISGTGDFNHDDKPDLVWANTTTGERTVWLMDGLTMIANVALPSVPPVWVVSAIADFNYDGKPDLVWTNTTTGERAIWLMNGTVFGSGVSLGTIPKEWTIATAADLNGDGKPDLIWQNTSTGESSAWLMNGGAFAAGVALDTLPAQWAIVGSGDFNADGKADLVLQNTVTGQRVLRLMNHTTFLSTISLGTFDPLWSIGN